MNIAKTLYRSAEYDVAYTPDVVYARRPCGDLLLQIVSPLPPVLPPPPPAPLNPVQEKFARWKRPEEKNRPAGGPFPLVVDCPGSGWAGADGHAHVPYLVDLARAGFVAASISYRGTYRDNVVFPAAVQDMKEAIRFLRANAAMFRIDPGRVGVLGDSSGGHTAALAALTGDDPSVIGFPDLSFLTGDHTEESMRVSACCCVYGPVDLPALVDDRIAEHKPLRPDEEPGLPFEAMELWQDTFLPDPARHLKAASPLSYVERARELPPLLYIIGDEDVYIPVAQGLRLCDALRGAGGRAEMIKVAGAGHGRAGVWGREMMAEVIRFFQAYL